MNPRHAEEEVYKARCEHAEDIRKQKEVDFERVAKEKAYEMAKKKDLIRQIRAIERVSVVRPVTFEQIVLLLPIRRRDVPLLPRAGPAEGLAVP